MGACASPCTAGAMRCSASGFVETCNPNGCGWSVSDNCSGFSVPARCCDDVRTRPQPQCVPTTVASSTLLLDPVNNATVRPGTVNLFWSPLVYSDRYRILVCTNAALNMGCLYNHFETPFGQNQYNVTLPAGTWYWSVAAIRACDYGGWGPFAPASRINVR